MPQDRLIDETARKYLTSVSRSTWWTLEQKGLAPKRRKIAGTSRVAWLESEILAWISSQAVAS